MFHGGTNWGFMNGANVLDRLPYYAPDVTSYGKQLYDNADITYISGLNVIFHLQKERSIYKSDILQIMMRQ